jgi:hypothetical protein
MWIFPFKNYFLQTSVDRARIHQKILELTFLSDAGYKKRDNTKKYFYGTVSQDLFSLQTINEEHRLVPFMEGEVKGVGDDIYLFLRLKAFKFRRLYVLIFLFAFVGAWMLAMEFLHSGISSFQNPPFLLLTLVILAVWFYLLRSCMVFWRIQKNTLDFFRGLLEAEAIDYKKVPIVFKL